MEHADFDKVRASVKQQCGNRVIIQLDKGRNKIDIQEGVIKEAYPSVFTILIDDSDNRPAQLLSFSYTDIITKEIRMKLCQNWFTTKQMIIQSPRDYILGIFIA